MLHLPTTLMSNCTDLENNFFHHKSKWECMKGQMTGVISGIFIELKWQTS